MGTPECIMNYMTIDIERDIVWERVISIYIDQALRGRAAFCRCSLKSGDFISQEHVSGDL